MSFSRPVAASSAASASPSQSSSRPHARVPLRVLIVAAVVYVLGLAATFPARFVLRWAGAPAEAAASGSVWAGAASIGEQTASWRIAPWRSIATFSLAADLRIEGDDTRLTGRATARPGALIVRDLEGTAGWPAIAALAPGLPFACDTRAEVDIRRLELGPKVRRASGELRTRPGLCISGRDAATLPALHATMSPDGAGSAIRLSERARPGVPLIIATAAPGGTRVSITAAGAAILPGGTGSAGAVLESGEFTAPPNY